MYIKAWRTKRNFAGSTKTRCGRGRKGPCFGVCAAVCDSLCEVERVPALDGDSERGRFVGDCVASGKKAESSA